MAEMKSNTDWWEAMVLLESLWEQQIELLQYLFLLLCSF